ncbi:MAG: MATE family efflux transporter [Clostridium sp.]
MSTVNASTSIGQERLFVDRAFRRFFVPSLLSNLSLALGEMVDCLTVGSQMGFEGLSAISLGIPVYMFYNLLSYGFSIGGSIHYAFLMGEGKPDEANRLFGNVLRFLLITYLVTAALGLFFLPQLLEILGARSEYSAVYTIAQRYIRAQLICIPIMFCQGPLYYFVHVDGSPKRAAVALTVSNAVDIVLNYVFVIRLNMGAEGSVWSTAIGAAFCLVICGTHIAKKRGALRFCWPPFDLRGLFHCIQTGFSSAVQYIYQFATVLCANTLLLSIGGPVGVAIFDVVYSLSQLLVAVADGIGMTLQPMISTYQSERDMAAIKRTVQLAVWYGSGLALVVLAGLIIWAKPLCALFGLSNEAENAGSLALWIYCAGILPALWNQIAIYYRQTTRQERSALVIQTLRLLVCLLLPMFALATFGLSAFWWVFPIAEWSTLCYVLFSVWRQKNSEEKGAVPALAPPIHCFSTYIHDSTLLGNTVEQLQRECEMWNCASQQSYYATLVVEEVCAAILEDAKNNHLDDVLIKLTVLIDQDGFVVHLRDNSYKFNPFSAEGDDAPNALGMLIVRKKAKQFFYRRYQGFNTLVILL